MTTTITQPIIHIEVINDTQPKPQPPTKRPKALPATTYKIQPPNESALYVTITHEPSTLQLQEIFINTKNPEHYQWIVALTRLISASFRLNLPTPTIITELRQIFSPTGGYFHDGKYHQSLVAEIGEIIQIEYNRLQGNVKHNTFPPEARICNTCGEKAVIIMDGCQTCLNCGDSKCQ